MKKSFLIASLAVVSMGVLGMSPVDPHKNVSNRSMQSISQKASTSSNTREESLNEINPQQSRKRKRVEEFDESLEEGEILRQTNPEAMEKIEAFISQRTEDRNYSSDLIKEALIHSCLHPEILLKNIAAEYGISYGAFTNYISYAKIASRKTKFSEEQITKALVERRNKKSHGKVAKAYGMNRTTLNRKAKERGEDFLRNFVDDKEILKFYKKGGTLQELYKIVTSDEGNAKTKFAEVISKKLNDQQKKSLVRDNEDLIKDYTEKLLTDKGRIDKYKTKDIEIDGLCKRQITECDDFLIRYIAKGLGCDLRKTPVTWKIEETSSEEFLEKDRNLIIRDYNDGKLTNEGLAEKYKTTKEVIYIIIKWGRRNNLEVKSRQAVHGFDKRINIASAETSTERLKKFGYKKSTVKTLEATLNQYNQLNLEQKLLFKELLNSKIRKMPSDEYVDSIKTIESGYNNVNKKFRNLLLVLCNREDEINMRRQSSINRLKKELEIWTRLAKLEEREKTKQEKHNKGKEPATEDDFRQS